MKTKYKKGDKVTIRTWDDMAEEYGLDGQGDIIKSDKATIKLRVNTSDCVFPFPEFVYKEMKEYCGTDDVVSYQADDGELELENCPHFVQCWMLEDRADGGAKLHPDEEREIIVQTRILHVDLDWMEREISDHRIEDERFLRNIELHGFSESH